MTRTGDIRIQIDTRQDSHTTNDHHDHRRENTVNNAVKNDNSSADNDNDGATTAQRRCDGCVTV